MRHQVTAPGRDCNHGPGPHDGQMLRDASVRFARALVEPAEGKGGWRHLTLLLPVAVLVAASTAIARVIFRLGHLPELSYREPVIAIEFARRLGVPGAVAGLVAIAAVIFVPALRRPWSALHHGDAARAFVGLATTLLAWSYAAYGFNHYFGQWHAVDRIALVAFVPLVWWRPIFAAPFAALVVPVIAQLVYPLGGFLWAVDGLLVRILVVFSVAFVALALVGGRETRPFWVVTACLVASQYWWPGYGKLELAWWSHGHVHVLPVMAHAQGWRAGAEPASIVAFGQSLSAIGPVLVWAPLAMEVSALLILWRRRTAIALLGGFAVFHVGTFVLMGYCFWKWLLVDLSLAVIAWGRRGPNIFGLGPALIGLALVATAGIWFEPPRLAWYDTPLVYTYRYEATGRSGLRYTLPPRLFAPYGDEFTMGGFGYLSRRPQLTGAYGATDNRAAAEALFEARSLADVERLEARFGRVQFDEARSRRFGRFVQRYLIDMCARGERHETRHWLGALGPPALLWSAGRGDTWDGLDPLTWVDVVRVTTLFDGEQIADLRHETLQRITIDR